MTTRHNITQTKAHGFPVPDKGQAMYWDSKQAGLGLRVTAAGARSWVVQGYVNGKSKRFTLGLLSDLHYTEAREEAGVVRGLMRRGIDPQSQKRKLQQTSEATSVTLREVMEDYVTHKRTKHGALRPSTQQGIRNNIALEFKDWADLPVVTITRETVVKRFRKLSKRAPTQTNLAFRNLRALLNWAREKYVADDGSYMLLPINPVTQALKQNGLVQWNKEGRRNGRIPKDKIGKVWVLLQEYGLQDYHPAATCTSADLIAFMLVTGCRVGEASSLTWANVDLDGEVPTFTLPASVTKNHTQLTLPISRALLAVLQRRLAAREKGNPFVFPAVRGGSRHLKDPRTMLGRVSAVAGVKVSNHDLRRTFDDIAYLTGVDHDVRRILLNHIAGDIHATNYANNMDSKVLLPEVNKVSAWVLGEAMDARPQCPPLSGTIRKEGGRGSWGNSEVR